MKRDAPAVLRKGAVIRVAGTEADAALTARAWAISYVDIQFDDGRVERWLGSGSLHDDPTRPLPYDTLLAWGEAVVGEHSMIGDLSMAFRDVDHDSLENAPIEISSSGTQSYLQPGDNAGLKSALVLHP